MIVEDQSQTIALLTGAAGGDGPVERLETHCAIVFLSGRRAWKLKKAVRYSYLDFGTAELRRRACEAELRLNRRTAPDIYLGIRPVTRVADGRLSLGGEGAAVDWVIEMRRFSQDDLLDRMAEEGRLHAPVIDALAERIAAFHAGAGERPEYGGAAGIRNVVDGNEASFAESPPDSIDPALAGRVTARARQETARLAPLLEARRAMGLVRRCHGDLHLRNICLIEGRPTLFDALEFSEALGSTDLLYDLAYLLMDLEHRGLRALANRVLGRYLAGDADGRGLPGLAALPLFMAVRAAVRAHVSAAAGAKDDAAAYLALADALGRPAPPLLVAVGGVSGTGKSTIARLLAPSLGRAPGALVLRSDVMRKALFGRAEAEPLPDEAYRPEISARVYAALHERAATALGAGQAVVLDAVHGTPAERAAAQALARAAGVPFRGLWLQAGEAVLAGRIEARRNDASDATAEVMRRQLRRIVPPRDWIELDAGGEAAGVLSEARRRLDLPA